MNNIALLDVPFRIIDVDGHKLTGLKFDEVIKVITNCKEKHNVVKFTLQRPVNLSLLMEDKITLTQKPDKNPPGRVPVNNHNVNNHKSKKSPGLFLNIPTKITRPKVKQKKKQSSISGSGGGSACKGEVRNSRRHNKSPISGSSSYGAAVSCLPPVESPEAVVDESTPLMANNTDRKAEPRLKASGKCYVLDEYVIFI